MRIYSLDETTVGGENVLWTIDVFLQSTRNGLRQHPASSDRGERVYNLYLNPPYAM